jgi:hypothetical protein
MMASKADPEVKAGKAREHRLIGLIGECVEQIGHPIGRGKVHFALAEASGLGGRAHRGVGPAIGGGLGQHVGQKPLAESLGRGGGGRTRNCSCEPCFVPWVFRREGYRRTAV